MKLFKNEDGASAVETAVVLALVVVSFITILELLVPIIGQPFWVVAGSLNQPAAAKPSAAASPAAVLSLPLLVGLSVTVVVLLCLLHLFRSGK